MTPIISVIMSAYNAEKYINQAIDSILTQTFECFEFLIINDGSTDSSELIIRSYNDKRVKLINNERNIGLTKSLNNGLDLVKSKYILRMDVDDISLSNRLEVQFDFMEQNPDIDIAGSWYQFFGEKNGISRTPIYHNEIRATLFFKNCIAHPTVIMRNSSLGKFNIKYCENFFYAQDYELWCRVANRLKLANIPEVLLKSRVHQDQIRIANRIEQDIAANLVRKINLEQAGIYLNKNESLIYFNVIEKKFNPLKKDHILCAGYIFDKIGIQCPKEYFAEFKLQIQFYLKYISDKGINRNIISIKFLFMFLLKWNVLKTSRDFFIYLFRYVKVHCA